MNLPKSANVKSAFYGVTKTVLAIGLKDHYEMGSRTTFIISRDDFGTLIEEIENTTNYAVKPPMISLKELDVKKEIFCLSL